MIHLTYGLTMHDTKSAGKDIFYLIFFMMSDIFDSRLDFIQGAGIILSLRYESHRSKISMITFFI